MADEGNTLLPGTVQEQNEKHQSMIHPTAIVDSHAELDTGVVVGPFTTIGPKVRIGKNTRIGGHAIITGHTAIGQDNVIHPFAFIGTEPQDVNYHGEDTRLVVGDGNTIREFVTIAVATTKYDWVTKVGSHNMIMSYCHIAHDCDIGSGTVIANALSMSGHVKLEDGVAIGGIVGIHQFVTVGRFAFIGGLSRITQDVPPFLVTEGNHARARCVNTVGLKRNNFDDARIQAIEDAFRALYLSDRPFNENLDELERRPCLTDDVKYLIQFVRNAGVGFNFRSREAIRHKKKE